VTYFKVIKREVIYDIRWMSYTVWWSLLLMPEGIPYFLYETWLTEEMAAAAIRPSYKIRYTCRHARSDRGQYRYRQAWAEIK
jgi:hypothetical protein